MSVPQGRAIETLQDAAEQSQVEIFYRADVVEGFYTHPVEGEYEPIEAFRLMLIGTPLAVFSDEKTGVYVIKEGVINDLPEIEPNPKNNKQMKIDNQQRNNLFSRLMRGISAVMIAGATANANAQDELEDEDVYLLSPFVVDASEDSGYYATNTLAGTRLKTSLRDVGSALSVYTNEFLGDIGASSAGELLTYTTNTEVGGLLGNFSSGTAGDAFVRVDTQRRNPQFATRVRGLSGADLTRDYFLTVIPLDSYNTDRVEINRGPNAILFGLGSAGGIINNGLSKAQFANKTFVETRVFGEGGARGVLDINREVIEGKLAVRLIGLAEEEQFVQEPTYEQDNRLYTNVLYKPLQNTTIRFTGETGRIEAIRPNPISPVDALSHWFDLGKPTWDPTLPASAQNTFGGAIAHPQTNRGISMIRDNSGIFPYGVPNQVRGRPVSEMRSTRSLNRTPVSSLPADHPLAGVTAPLKHQGFTDLNTFNFRDYLLSGEANRQFQRFNAINFTVEQTFLDQHLGVELAYDKQDYDDHYIDNFGSQNRNVIYIDMNTVLPDGVANPNFGRPFLSFQSRNSTNNEGWNDREAVRATVFAEWDMADVIDGWGKWLGRHVATGFFNTQTVDSFSSGIAYAWEGENANTLSPRLTDFPRRVATYYYIGDSIANAQSIDDVKITGVPNIAPEAFWDFGGPVRAKLFNSNGDLVEQDLTPAMYRNSGSITRNTVDSYAAVLQSHWFSDTIVTIVGWRKDESESYLSDVGRFPDNSIDLSTLALREDPSLEAAGENFTYSIVAHLPDSWKEKMPWGMDISLHYNESENFRPALRRNIFNEPIAPPSGRTTEYGFTLSAQENKYVLKVNWYETSTQNETASFNGAGFLNNLELETIIAWNRTGSMGGFDADGRYQTLLLTGVDPTTGERIGNGIPQNILDAWRFNIVTDPETGFRDGDYLNPGVNDITNVVSEGIEFEGIINPTNNWRIAFNASKQEAVRSNTNPFTAEWLEFRKPVFDAVSHLIWRPDLNGTQTFGERLEEFGTIPLAQAQNLDGTVTPELREWRFNLISNYQFSEGPLDGFGFGGAVRWQDDVAIGFRQFRDEQGTVIVDTGTPYFGPAETNVDVWFGYERPIFDGKVDWKIQLNIRNINTSDDDLIPINTQPNGVVSQVRVAPPRTWFVTNTFSF